jgi:hypothetical protein
MSDWYNSLVRLPSGGSVVPGQSGAGGTPQEAAQAQQELYKQKAGEEQSHYTQLGQSAERAAGSWLRYNQALNRVPQDADIFGPSYIGQFTGYGATDIAHRARIQQTKNPDVFGKEVSEESRKWEEHAGEVDSSNNDLLLHLQGMYRMMGRGGGGSPSTSQPQNEAMPRGNLPVLQNMLGSRQTDLRSSLHAKAQQPLNDIFEAMGDAYAHGQYSLDQAMAVFGPYGYSRNEVLQALKTRQAPASQTPAGGATHQNKSGVSRPAASPLPGGGGDHGDQEGTKPPPSSTPGRGNQLRPTYQAGFSGEGHGNITERGQMEPMQQGQELPPVPRGLSAARAAQWQQGVQLLFQHPELTAEFDKRFDPMGAGLGKRILQKYRPQGM